MAKAQENRPKGYELDGSPAWIALWIDRLLAATDDWTPEEFGAYMRLLLKQGQRGFLPANPRRLARMTGLSLTEFEELWRSLLRAKFEEVPDDPDRLFNPRMDTERSYALDGSEGRSAKARKAARTRWEKERRRREEEERRSRGEVPEAMPEECSEHAPSMHRAVPEQCSGDATQTQTQTHPGDSHPESASRARPRGTPHEGFRLNPGELESLALNAGIGQGSDGWDALLRWGRHVHGRTRRVVTFEAARALCDQARDWGSDGFVRSVEAALAANAGKLWSPFEDSGKRGSARDRSAEILAGWKAESEAAGALEPRTVDAEVRDGDNA
ncbi:MAG: YdaU family protein [bacterium]|nr:YdaU family protein [bacterium]